MATETVYANNDISIQSSWKCKKDTRAAGAGARAETGKDYIFEQAPSTGSGTMTFSYSLPSGAKISSATLTATLGSPLSGIALCTANGTSFRGSMSLTLGSNSGSLSVTFAFKANGTKTDTNQHTASLTIKNATLSIEYEDEEEEESDVDDLLTDAIFAPPPQSVMIYDQDDGKYYTFDGVTKIQQESSLKIEEDPSTKKELYINNARNEPDKVKLDVMMSDVYTGGGNLVVSTSDGTSEYDAAAVTNFISNGDTRSAAAVAVLHSLKENRHKITVVTPQYVYIDMLLQDLTVTQDETCPFGWSGQVSFQEMYETATKTDSTSSTADSANVQTRSPSWWFTTFGKVA